MYSHRDQYSQQHDGQQRPTLPSLSTYLGPTQVPSALQAHAVYQQQHHQQTPHYQQSLPSLSQLLNQPGNPYTAQQQQQLLEQQQYAYTQQHQGYALPVAHHVQQQQQSLSYAAYPPLPASPAPPSMPVRYASPVPHQQYASPSPPASPVGGTPTPARPFACDFCKAGFSRPHDLKRHRASVHFRNDAEGPTCNRCGRPFSRPDALRRHAQRGCHVGEDGDN
ncbi:hypothetical protein EXIGLDRAFT_760460 [Exidia glandulosa HHB12029]|uniref:C2H2-type domain-containing protein n=1 Tax=Exidia glandulosa HHB12029 TaxID=1314781 RepID=A0A165P9T0_EXIGL|nr:hypothetical protein EXIGLDRAFT_760460 [Exidia glandulosa HHB12029]